MLLVLIFSLLGLRLLPPVIFSMVSPVSAAGEQDSGAQVLATALLLPGEAPQVERLAHACFHHGRPDHQAAEDQHKGHPQDKFGPEPQEMKKSRWIINQDPTPLFCSAPGLD